MQNLCVFCGSNPGLEQQYPQAAQELGFYLARQGIRLVYGAGNVGLMGIMADASLAEGGKVTGVIPGFLKEKEVCHQGLDELIVVDTMHQRKAIMAERADGFIALPGGFGTLDELAEILTWGQLGLHGKPVGLWNVGGYFDALATFFDTMVEKGFLTQTNRNMVLLEDDLPTLIQAMDRYEPPDAEKWLNRAQV